MDLLSSRWIRYWPKVRWGTPKLKSGSLFKQWSATMAYPGRVEGGTFLLPFLEAGKENEKLPAIMYFRGPIAP